MCSKIIILKHCRKTQPQSFFFSGLCSNLIMSHLRQQNRCCSQAANRCRDSPDPSFATKQVQTDPGVKGSRGVWIAGA